MTVHAQYAAKRVTPAEAIRNIHNGDTIVVPTAVAEPPASRIPCTTLSILGPVRPATST